ncbi:hypothetical protein GOODEAATRI_001204 [Goodea atripinnis]|uniref:Uncharacterized protein n=1 Tax=Goodea atripinnis TaxID=208336 RepID=A0ABV0NQX5_9TELE
MEYFEDLLGNAIRPSLEEAETENLESDLFITQAEVTKVVKKLSCGAVMADTPFQHCMAAGDSTSGLADWETGGCVPTTGGSHSSPSLVRPMPGYWREESGL